MSMEALCRSRRSRRRSRRRDVASDWTSLLLHTYIRYRAAASPLPFFPLLPLAPNFGPARES